MGETGCWHSKNNGGDMKYVRIYHETNPKKYYGALYLLHDNEEIIIKGSYRCSVVKEWFRSGIRDRLGFYQRTYNSIVDVFGRFSLPFIKNEVIILGMAPWDYRILWFLLLSNTNSIFYHTSWHEWGHKSTPRKYSYFTIIFESLWSIFLKRDNVKVVCVHEASRQSFLSFYPCKKNTTYVVPHAVPEVFYRDFVFSEEQKSNPNFLYVGELSDKKGVHKILDMKRRGVLGGRVTIVGDGELREECIRASHEYDIDFKGAIFDKVELAKVYAQSDVFLLFSERKNGWEELFGIVMVEAMASGLVVVASNHIGPETIVKDRVYPLLESVDDVLFLEFMEYLKRNNNFEALLAEGGKVAKEYKIDSIAEKWLQVINFE